jgi:hypothetical protein
LNEEAMEIQRLEDEPAVEERLQTDAAIVAICLGMELSPIYFVSIDFFKNCSGRTK